MTVWLIIIAAVVICGLWVLFLYNKIVDLRNRRESAWSDIDVQLNLRFDLVDNLVETVKGYAKHEKSTLESIVKARHMYNSTASSDVKGKSDADNILTGTLKTLFATVEASYPELKADKHFTQLQTELSDIENKIAAARRYFNATTKEYNNEIQHFPANILFHYMKEDYFETTEEAKKNPKVKFED